MTKKKAFVGTVDLFQNGKCYGATSRQVYAENRASAIKVLKEKFKFKDNVVKVTKLDLVKEIKKRGFY